MRKFGLFSTTVFLFALIAGCYGAIHNQITFSISYEYFTKFKFVLFNINPKEFGGERISAGIIGFLASWWMGLLIGIVISVIGLLFKNHLMMKVAMMRSIFIVLFTTVISAGVGFLYGKLYLVHTTINWWFPEHLLDKQHFIIAGSIHNFSYLGGCAGLLISIVYVTVMLLRSSK